MCKRCGKETVVIGYEESSQLDVEPAKYFVLVTKREKRACRSCEELGVVSAPLPRRIIEKCLRRVGLVMVVVHPGTISEGLLPDLRARPHYHACHEL